VREAHDEEADGRVPEADHVPGQRHREQYDENEVDRAEPTCGQRHHQEPDHPGDRGADERSEQETA
jgi:hypothetical protein